MSDSVFAGSPFLRESAAVDQRAEGRRDELRVRHDQAAADARAAGRADDEAPLAAATRRLEDLLAASRQDLGPRDPDTLMVEGSLAVAYLLGDDETRGLDLAIRNLAAREEILGSDHPSSLAAADAVAAAHRITGRPEAALARYGEVIHRRMHLFGDAHPLTLASRAGLALARADHGDLRGAAGILSTALDTADRYLGAAHPTTLDVREILAEVVDAQRRDDLAAHTDRQTSVIPRLNEDGEPARPVHHGHRRGALPA